MVAVSELVAELYFNPVFVYNSRSPIASVENIGKHIVSAVSLVSNTLLLTPVTVPENVPEIVPPTFKFLAIPTPPSTIKAPIVVAVDSVTLFKLTAPSTFNVPPILAFSAIPTPPVTFKAPVIGVVDVSLFGIETTPAAETVALVVKPNVEIPDTFNVPPLIAPVVVILSAPLSIEPNPEVIDPALSGPTLVIFVWEAVRIVPDKLAFTVPVVPEYTPLTRFAVVKYLNVLSDAS